MSPVDELRFWVDHERVDKFVRVVSFGSAIQRNKRGSERWVVEIGTRTELWRGVSFIRVVD